MPAGIAEIELTGPFSYTAHLFHWVEIQRSSVYQCLLEVIDGELYGQRASGRFFRRNSEDGKSRLPLFGIPNHILEQMPYDRTCIDQKIDIPQ